MGNRTEKDIMATWQSNQRPVVSICCTTYNHEDFIGEAIDGFLEQETDFAIEIIIRDDCSTDLTAMVVKQYADEYPKVIKPIYESENQYSRGVKPMPAVMKQAVGKYLALCEGDDYWNDPLKLTKQVEFLEANDEYVGCFHNSMVVDEKGSIVRDTLMGAPRDFLEMDLLSSNAVITVHSVMFRNVLEYGDEFDEVAFGDMMLWHLLGYHGKVKYLNNVQKAAYRIHDAGMWTALDNCEKFEKTLFSKQILRQKMAARSINTRQINRGVDRYVLTNLTASLIDKDYGLYKNLISKLREFPDVSRKRIPVLVVQSILKKIWYEIDQIALRIKKNDD